MRKIFTIIILLSVTISGCDISANEAYYTKEYADIGGSPVVLEGDFEDVTQEEMMSIFQNNYGWTNLKSHELLWNGNTILMKFHFGVDARRFQIDAARTYAYKEMKYPYINNYEPTPYQLWRMSQGTEIEPIVCLEVYIDDILLIQDLYEEDIPLKYENTAIKVEARNINPSWAEAFEEYVSDQIAIDRIEYQNSLLGKAVILQIYSDDLMEPNIKDEVEDYIKNEIAPKATRDNKLDTANQGKYEFIILELYKSDEEYYEGVLINREQVEWIQIDWMNN